MKHVILISIFTLSALAQTQYSIDTAHSSARFSVTHLMVSQVHGEFRKLSGSIVFDRDDPGKSKVEALIDARTIDTRDRRRDENLKSEDFFDVAKYPSLTFRSTKVESKAGKYLVTGDLTIHGVTRPAVLTVDGPTAEVRDPWGMLRAAANAITTIDRKDFGLVWNKAIDNGGVMIGDVVTINLDIEMLRKSDTKDK